MIKPKHLEEGDKVGMVSPSGHIQSDSHQERMKRVTKYLENKGIEVEFGENAKGRYSYASGTVEERVNDIHDFFRRNDIDAVVGTKGGENSNSLLPHLDYNLIEKNPKIFMGASDLTCLNLAIHKKTGLVTFHGGLSTASKEGKNAEYSREYAEKSVFSDKPIGKIKEPEEPKNNKVAIYEGGSYDKEHFKRKEKMVEEYKNIRPGKAKGVIKGGNLASLVKLAGTGYMPDFKDSIIMIERMGAPVKDIEQKMEQIDQLGIFKDINGMVFGRPALMTRGGKERTFKGVLKEYADEREFPLLLGPDFGHTLPSLTLPIGVEARMNASEKELEILESGVK